jgi:hypothetical protein
VHGDDYFSSAHAGELDWLEEQLKKKYEIQSQRIGAKKDENELKILNIIVRKTATGYELEADPRHAELALLQMKLETAKPLSTPGVDGKDEDDREGELPLDPERSKQYRSIVARLNYLSADRPDMQYSVKELCRDMSGPSEGSWRRLERACRYLVGTPRLVWKFEMQQPTATIDTFSDANWAGCRRARKSTSGGAIVIGTHLIKTYSKTQATIARSSAESELYAIVRATSESLGMLTLLDDLGCEFKARIHMDATAAQGVIDRQGISKIRHLDVNALWLQEQLAREYAPISKVLGTKNGADLMTKNVDGPLMLEHCKRLMLETREGRSLKAAELQSCGRPARVARAEDCMLAACERYAEGNRHDSWNSRGAEGRWVRIHSTPRRSLFTPCRVPRGPARPDLLDEHRVTEGTYADGTKFKIIDDWRQGGRAHRVLDQPWTGVTTFAVV